jgi:hypothetical protein
VSERDEPRVVERAHGHGNGEPFKRNDLNGVNLACDEDHDRQLVSAIYFDAETGEAFPRDGARAVLEDHAGVQRERWKFRCPQCHRTVVVRAEKLDAIVAQLVQHGVTELTLTGLHGILRRN